jgi:hypothetical protein
MGFTIKGKSKTKQQSTKTKTKQQSTKNTKKNKETQKNIEKKSRSSCVGGGANRKKKSKKNKFCVSYYMLNFDKIKEIYKKSNDPQKKNSIDNYLTNRRDIINSVNNIKKFEQMYNDLQLEESEKPVKETTGITGMIITPSSEMDRSEQTVQNAPTPTQEPNSTTTPTQEPNSTTNNGSAYNDLLKLVKNHIALAESRTTASINNMIHDSKCAFRVMACFFGQQSDVNDATAETKKAIETCVSYTLFYYRLCCQDIKKIISRAQEDYNIELITIDAIKKAMDLTLIEITNAFNLADTEAKKLFEHMTIVTIEDEKEKLLEAFEKLKELFDVALGTAHEAFDQVYVAAEPLKNDQKAFDEFVQNIKS